MGFTDRRLHRRITDAEQDACALRSRERHVEAGDGSAAPQFRSRARILACEDAVQWLCLDRVSEAERNGATPLPPARRLGAADVVVLRAGGDRVCRAWMALRLVEVVTRLSGLELADGDHCPSGRRDGVLGNRMSILLDRGPRPHAQRASVCGYLSLACKEARLRVAGASSWSAALLVWWRRVASGRMGRDRSSCGLGPSMGSGGFTGVR